MIALAAAEIAVRVLDREVPRAEHIEVVVDAPAEARVAGVGRGAVISEVGQQHPETHRAQEVREGLHRPMVEVRVAAVDDDDSGRRGALRGQPPSREVQNRLALRALSREEANQLPGMLPVEALHLRCDGAIQAGSAHGEVLHGRGGVHRRQQAVGARRELPGGAVVAGSRIFVGKAARQLRRAAIDPVPPRRGLLEETRRGAQRHIGLRDEEEHQQKQAEATTKATTSPQHAGLLRRRRVVVPVLREQHLVLGGAVPRQGLVPIGLEAIDPAAPPIAQPHAHAY